MGNFPEGVRQVFQVLGGEFEGPLRTHNISAKSSEHPPSASLAERGRD